MAEAHVLASRVSGAQSERPAHQRVPGLTVRSVLKEKHVGLHYVDSHFRSLDALQILADKSIEAVLVLDAGQIVGIFSLQGFARTTLQTGLSTMAVPVSNVMTSCSCRVSPDDSAQTCLHLMHENNLQFIPVQEAGHAVALLSRVDLLSEIVLHYERIFRESALDQQILFLRGTYSC